MRWIAALLLVGGCSAAPSAPDVALSVDPSDAALREAVQAAVDEWDACGARQATLTAPGLPVAVVARILTPDGSEAGGETLRAPSGAVVAIHVERFGADAQRMIVAHEIGHVLGLGHLGSGIMSETHLRAGTHVGDAECAALRSLSP
jgi:hypothetical protein